MKRGYTFDDIALVPQFTNVPPRTEPNLETWLTKNLKVKIPLIAANMDSVIGEELADVLIPLGSIPIFHRYTPIEEQVKWVKRYSGRTFISCGIETPPLDQVRRLLDLGALGVCIDVAHGHSDRMFKMIGEIKSKHPKKDVIAGNVCTPMAYHDLVNAGADAVKVGVGSGSACKTRQVTGFGVPQFTAIYECAQIAEKLRIPLIADGGIRAGRDVVLALAAGASTVMLGNLFAMTLESNAPKRPSETSPTKLEAKYRGQSSQDFQNDYYGALNEKKIAEGIDFWGPVAGDAHTVIEKLLGGLRSALTYGGAKNIKELQRKAEFMEVPESFFGQ